MAFLELTGRTPEPRESKLFNAMVVTLVEHGLTPERARRALTYLGAPKPCRRPSRPACGGLGGVRRARPRAGAKLLSEAVARGDDAKRIIAAQQEDPGLGHRWHKPRRPSSRAAVLKIARGRCYYGKFCELMEAVGKMKGLPVNATGAIGALACELGFDWKVCRGLGVMARGGRAGRQPAGGVAAADATEEIWLRIDEEASAHAQAKK